MDDAFTTVIDEIAAGESAARRPGRAKLRAPIRLPAPAPGTSSEAPKPRRRKAKPTPAPMSSAPSANLSNGGDAASARASTEVTPPRKAPARAPILPHGGHFASDPLPWAASVAGGDPIPPGGQKPLAHLSTCAAGGEPQRDDLPGPAGAVAASDERAHSTNGHQKADPPLIAQIVALWRMRVRWHKAEKALILQGRAMARGWTEGDKTGANRLFDRSAKGDDGIDPFLAAALGPFHSAIARFQQERAVAERHLRKLARSLPVWPWVEGVTGFGALNLAAVAGECGDKDGRWCVGDFRSPSALWKRMGLAVIDGGRQRMIAGDDAKVHGYNPERRAIAWNLGECLIKAGERNPYRQVYLDRKAYEAERVATPIHAHKRAVRYMTKRVLRDLWKQWRRAAQVAAPADA